MNTTLRGILGVIAGLIIGSIVNGGLISLGPHLIPPPTDVDVTTMEGLNATMHLFEPKHFLFPFFAHALGTFVGALVAGLIAVDHRMRFALAVGFIFLIGGIVNVVMLSAPMWFNVVDLVFAYIPMAYIAGKITTRNRV